MIRRLVYKWGNELGLFARWKAKRELNKAVKRVKKHPSSKATADLIDKYVAAGQLASLGAKGINLLQIGRYLDGIGVVP